MTGSNIFVAFEVVGAVATIKAINDVARAVNRLPNAVKSATSLLSSSLNIIGLGFKAVGTAAAYAAGNIAGVGIASLKFVGQAQKMQVALNTLYNSSKKGKEAFRWAMMHEAVTPYTGIETVQAMTQLKAFGYDPKKVLTTIEDFVLSFGGDFQKLTGVIQAMGKTAAHNKPYLQGLQGQPQLVALFYEVGRKMAGLKPTDKVGRLADLPIDGRKFIENVLTLMKARAQGTTEAMSKTLEGRWSTFMSKLQWSMLAVGKVLLNPTMKILDRLIEISGSQWFREGAARLYAIITQMVSLNGTVDRIGRFLQKAVTFHWFFDLIKWVIDFYYDVKFGIITIKYALAAIKDRLLYIGANITAAILTIGAGIQGAVNGITAALFEFGSKISIFGRPVAGEATRKDWAQKAYDLTQPGANPLGAKAEAARVRALGLNPDSPMFRFVTNLQKGVEYGMALRGEKGAAGWVDRLHATVDKIAKSATDLSVPVPERKAAALKEMDLEEGRARVSDLIDRIIIGGGERGARGVRATELGRWKPSKPVSPIKVSVDAGNTPIGKALARMFEELFDQFFAKALADPKTRQYMSTQLAGYAGAR